MLKLFGIFAFVLVFFITVMMPSSHANHDDVPSHVQNNTGWDRELFHEYDLYTFSDEFGYFLMAYDVDGFIHHDFPTFDPNVGTISLKVEHDDNLMKIFIPNFLIPSEYFSELSFLTSYAHRTPIGGYIGINAIDTHNYNCLLMRIALKIS